MTATATNTKTDWLGKFPAHWQVLRIKNLFQEIDSRSETGSEELLSVSYHTGVYPKRESLENEDDHLTNAASLIGYKKVAKGDLIINIMGAWNGRLGISAYDGITSPAYCVYRLKGNNNPEYFGYLFRTTLFVSEFLKHSAGIGTGYLRLYSDKFFSIYSVVPPKDEQDQIVQYIKAKEEKINRFIEKKQRFIELLKEQKLRTINIAVTKGVNEKAKLKLSGVVWLDLVPEHWVFAKITYYAEVKDGTHDTPQYVEPSEDSITFVTSAILYDGFIDFANAKHISKQDHINIYKRSNTEKNDILMSMIGGNIGSCVLVDTDIEFSIKNVCLYKTSNSQNLNANFFLYLLKSIQLKAQIQLTQSGSAQPFLGLGELRAMRFFFPPIEEQKQIVEHIKTETATIDTAIAKAEREIELIREYKEAMISEAVMGKIL